MTIMQRRSSLPSNQYKDDEKFTSRKLTEDRIESKVPGTLSAISVALGWSTVFSRVAPKILTRMGGLPTLTTSRCRSALLFSRASYFYH